MTIETLALEIYDLCNNPLFKGKDIVAQLQERYTTLQNRVDWQENILRYKRTAVGLEALAKHLFNLLESSSIKDIEFIVVNEQQYLLDAFIHIPETKLEIPSIGRLSSLESDRDYVYRMIGPRTFNFDRSKPVRAYIGTATDPLFKEVLIYYQIQ